MLVGYCRRSGTHPKEWSGGMPSQFWSATEGLPTPLCYPQRYNLDVNLEDIAPKTDFTCTRCHGVHGGFHQASLEPGPSSSELRTLQTGHENKWIMLHLVNIFGNWRLSLCSMLLYILFCHCLQENLLYARECYEVILQISILLRYMLLRFVSKCYLKTILKKVTSIWSL